MPYDDENPLYYGQANPLRASPSLADAWQFNATLANNWLATQRQRSYDAGLADPATGLPTQAGMMNAAQMYSNALMMGTTAPRFPRETINIAPNVDMRINPSVPELKRLMDRHGGLRLISNGDNVAVAPARDTVHDEMLSVLRRSAHPLGDFNNDAWIAVHDGTVIDANAGENNIGGISPEQWPLSLQLLFGKALGEK